MNPIAKNVLAVVVGFAVGAAINMGLITLGMAILPLPEGTDVSNMEAVRKIMPTLPASNFIFPFVGHALGTLVGAFVAAKLAASRPLLLALCIGAIFLMGGVAMILNCGGPTWFIAADLLLAYFPMAWLGGILAGGSRSLSAQSH